MKSEHSAKPALSGSVSAEYLGKVRRVRVAFVSLSAVLFAVMCFTAISGARGATVRRHASGSCGSSLTSFDAPNAGTSMLQGTGAVSINDNGDIAGIYVTSPNLAHGYVRTPAGVITEFDAPDAGKNSKQGTFPTSINAGGDVTGLYIDASNAYHGFVRVAASGTVTEFDVTGAPTNIGHRGSAPLSINTTGEITGMYVDGNAVRHGFVRATDGTFTTFDTPGAGSNPTLGTIAMSVNAGGTVTGFYIDSNQLSHAFVRAANGTITAPIDAPNASTIGKSKKGFNFSGTIAEAIDTAGDVVGVYADTNSINHGFVRSAAGTITEFDVTGAGTTGLFPGTLPTSISSSGDVAGFYGDTNGVNHGFWRAAGGAITAPLDAPNAATSGMFNGTVPFSINSTDNLTGVYIDASGVFHAFLLATSSQAATPTFSPAGGTYTSAQTVSISDATAGAAIFYTTDGSTPGTSSTPYTGPITVSSTKTIKAIAMASGCSISAVASATYTINAPADFQVSVNPTTLTIVAGQSGTAQFTVTPTNGFNSPVSFACSGLPSEATCTFNPTSVTPNGAAVTSSLTVMTTAKSAALGPSFWASRRLIYAFLFPLLASLLFNGGEGGRKNIGLWSFLLCLLLLPLTACGGSGGNSTNTGNPGTPPGTSSVSVVASTSGSGGTNHAATLTITITQ